MGYASLAGSPDVLDDEQPRVPPAILDCPVDAILERAEPPAATG